MNTDTPRTEACPFYEDKYDSEKFYRFECGTIQKFPSGYIRSEMCHQSEVANLWKKRSERAEEEITRLRRQIEKLTNVANRACNLLNLKGGYHESYELRNEIKTEIK